MWFWRSVCACLYNKARNSLWARWRIFQPNVGLKMILGARSITVSLPSSYSGRRIWAATERIQVGSWSWIKTSFAARTCSPQLSLFNSELERIFLTSLYFRKSLEIQQYSLRNLRKFNNLGEVDIYRETFCNSDLFIKICALWKTTATHLWNLENGIPKKRKCLIVEI